MMVYDGALVPYRPTPEEAVLAPRTRELLHQVATCPSTTLVVVSGRRVAELEGLLSGIPAYLVGEHGWDERTVDGHVVLHALPGEAASILGRAARAARENGFGEHVERKRCSLTLHTRALAPERAREIENACLHLWGEAFQRRGVRLTRIDGGVELRALATHEGTAVARLLASASDGTMPVYVGDDRPDEDAFLSMFGRGEAIRVGPAARQSLAAYHLRDCDEVGDFLERWAVSTDRRR